MLDNDIPPLADQFNGLIEADANTILRQKSQHGGELIAKYGIGFSAVAGRVSRRVLNIAEHKVYIDVDTAIYSDTLKGHQIHPDCFIQVVTMAEAAVIYNTLNYDCYAVIDKATKAVIVILDEL